MINCLMLAGGIFMNAVFTVHVWFVRHTTGIYFETFSYFGIWFMPLVGNIEAVNLF